VADDTNRTIEVRSYHEVFDLERRIYSLGMGRGRSLRLNPKGVPVRGVAYSAAAILAFVIAGRLPILGVLIGVIPWWPITYLVIPSAIGAVLAMAKPEGRAAHHWVTSRVHGATAARHLTGGLVSTPSWWTHAFASPLVLIPNGTESIARRFTYTGPGIVRVAIAHRREITETPTLLDRLRRRPAAQITPYTTHAPARDPRMLTIPEGAQLVVTAPVDPPRKARSRH
jgi:hypothetical protein